MSHQTADSRFIALGYKIWIAQIHLIIPRPQKDKEPGGCKIPFAVVLPCTQGRRKRVDDLSKC